jgi:EAL domain-containing protein (putative c-di-GMP-specific phosphodiesterase class I)/CheY-like chemotaxis protein
MNTYSEVTGRREHRGSIAAKSRTPRTPRTDAAKGRVLVVEDEEVIRDALGPLLEEEGYAVSFAEDGHEALRRLNSEALPDIIVLDLRMPVMDGWEFRTIQKDDPRLGLIPVVAVSADGSAQAAAISADAFLRKPVGPKELLATIERILVENGSGRRRPAPLPRVREDAVARGVLLRQMGRARRETVEEFRAQHRQPGDRAGLEAGFARALSGLWMAYQPIVSCSGGPPYAYEALVRTDESILSDPVDFFDAAERLNRLHELGRAIRRQVADTIAQFPASALVFVNVNPADLQDATLFAPESPLSAFGSRVVLEITERAALDQIPDVTACMMQLRAMGYRIAIDDLGAGYAGLTSFALLEPDVVKVDMSIVRGIDQSTTKQKLMGAIINLCRDLKIQMIAEGIETPCERDTIVGLGGDLCQGYLFAHPGKPLSLPSFSPHFSAALADRRAVDGRRLRGGTARIR